MERQIPVESEGLGPIGGAGWVIGVVGGVNDESACLVEHFKPTQYELEVLARHYLEEARNIEFKGQFLGYSGSHEIRMRPFAYRRLATIEGVLGKHKFDKAIAQTEEEHNRGFAKAAEIEKNLEPCKGCGAKRDYCDYAFSSTDDYCGACDQATQGHSNLSGLRITLTEEQMATVDPWLEKNRRITEAHISKMTGGPID